jgi:hypothetical protein
VLPVETIDRLMNFLSIIGLSTGRGAVNEVTGVTGVTGSIMELEDSTALGAFGSSLAKESWAVAIMAITKQMTDFMAFLFEFSKRRTRGANWAFWISTPALGVNFMVQGYGLTPSPTIARTCHLASKLVMQRN